MNEICCDPCEMVLNGSMDLCGGAECPEHPDRCEEDDGFGGGWNYRIIKKESGDDCCYAIHEVFYDIKGIARSCTTAPVFPLGETETELTETFNMYTQAFDKPVLDYETFVKEES